MSRTEILTALNPSRNAAGDVEWLRRMLISMTLAWYDFLALRRG